MCVFPTVPWRKYDSQRPLFGGDFLGQILAVDSLPGAFVHSRITNRKVTDTVTDFLFFQRAPNPPEFAQPRLSRVKARSSPARGYKFGCVCSYMAGHEDAGVVTGHIGTNTPKFVPPRWGRPRFDPTQTGLWKFGRGFGAR